VDPIISTTIQGVIGLVLAVIGLKLPSWLNSAKKKNQAQEWLAIANGVVSLILINNPNLAWRTVMQNAIDQLQQQIDGLSPEIAKRLVADALYSKGVTGATEGLK